MALRIESLRKMDHEETVMLGGRDVGLLPRRLLLGYSQQIGSILMQNPNTMLYVPEDTNYHSMVDGNSSLIMGVTTEELIAYSRSWELESGDIEIGTWISRFKGGFGTSVFKKMIEVARGNHPGKRLLAATEVNNIQPQKKINQMGGVYLRTRKSDQIFTPDGGNAVMIEYDVTRAGL